MDGKGVMGLLQQMGKIAYLILFVMLYKKEEVNINVKTKTL